ncbi:CLUMA_CG007131, isoform A [Clunio marinus]|uniref:Vacuolar protein sorting-associated protein 54 n=1 Tax=Clunio marinus TaxID=568069 RepID=A0A1J1I403_9DIPT|nr:CLUMA_CG007131, isoform A [Clunio marinus]
MAKSLQAIDFKQTAWKSCNYCSNHFFKTPNLFLKHLREKHCTVEGGSFVCHYGYNGVCSSLPLDGVSDKDYEAHVEKYHVSQSMKEAEEKWNIFSAAQNLPAVLNDPSRGRQSNLFTKKWGDSFVDRQLVPPSSLLPRIDWTHLELYCKKIGKRFRRHTRLGSVGSTHDFKAPTSSSISPSSSISSLQIIDTSNLRTINENVLNETTIRDIPQVFLKQDLDFSQPETFALVFLGLDINSDDDHQELQDKLSHYLDIVEIQISKQISQKSSSFFHAMTSQDTIMEEMSKAVRNVRKLREKLCLIDNTLVRQSLNIISCERIKTNKQMVLEKLRLMATVHQTQPMIQVLLGTQDYVAALDLISTTQEILAQELSGIHCFRHLPHQLKELEKLIDKMLTTDFEKYTTSDLNRPLIEDDYRVLDEDKIVSIISGLLRKKNFTFIDSYKDEAITTIRALIKQLVIEVIASSDVEICLTGSGEEAQSLSLQEWILLLEAATASLIKLLKRVRLIHDVMLHVADSSAGRNIEGDNVSYLSDSETFLTITDHNYIENKLTNLLQSVGNYCHERCANLVSNQSLEQYSGTLEEMEKLSQIVEEFCSSCEEVIGIKSIPLMTAFKAQGTRFSQKFHSERKSKLSLLLDNERWKPAEVPGEFQKMVNYIAKGSFMWTKIEDNQANEPSIAAPMLMVGDEPFALVGAALILVQIVSEYCRCSSHLPIIAVQMGRNVIDLLRTFNSRCCQLVLGAGAVHVAGLKMITISNLALVSRALQLVLWLIPHVKNHFNNLVANGNAGSLSGWATVEKDFLSHIKEIENKMLMIVGQLVNQQLLNWDARPPIPSQSFRNISRHFVKLHEAIAQVLPSDQIHCVFRTVHKNFKDKLREQLLRNNIINNGTPQHGTVISELTFYLETLRTLKAMPVDELSDETMDDIWIK